MALVAQSDVDAAIRQADIVQRYVDLTLANYLIDGLFHMGEIFPRLLNLRPCRRSDVQSHLAGIDLGEEIHAQSREERDRQAGQQQKEAGGCQRPRSRPGDRIVICPAKIMKPPIKEVVHRGKGIQRGLPLNIVRSATLAVPFDVRTHQVFEKHRNQCEGKNQTGQQ